MRARGPAPLYAGPSHTPIERRRSPLSLHLLVVASETPDQQNSRRARTGQASHETLADTLRALDPGCRLAHASCVDGSGAPGALESFSGVVFAGSPIQMHEDTDEARAAASFAARAFQSGTPSFGSCAGLQIATVGAGGTTKAREEGMEVGFARSIVPTAAGRDHPMLHGRPVAWDALAMHSSVVDRRPDGMTVLARTAETPVEIAEIRSGGGWHWGVQYHPELRLSEIADAVRASASSMIEQGMARSEADVDGYAAILEAIDRDPSRRDLAWQIGIDAEVTHAERRRGEIINFLARLQALR